MPLKCRGLQNSPGTHRRCEGYFWHAKTEDSSVARDKKKNIVTKKRKETKRNERKTKCERSQITLDLEECQHPTDVRPQPKDQNPKTKNKSQKQRTYNPHDTTCKRPGGWTKQNRRGKLTEHNDDPLGFDIRPSERQPLTTRPTHVEGCRHVVGGGGEESAPRVHVRKQPTRGSPVGATWRDPRTSPRCPSPATRQSQSGAAWPPPPRSHYSSHCRKGRLLSSSSGPRSGMQPLRRCVHQALHALPKAPAHSVRSGVTCPN